MLRVSGFDGRVDVRTSSKTWAQELGMRQGFFQSDSAHGTRNLKEPSF